MVLVSPVKGRFLMKNEANKIVCTFAVLLALGGVTMGCAAELPENSTEPAPPAPEQNTPTVEADTLSPNAVTCRYSAATCRQARINCPTPTGSNWCKISFACFECGM